MYLHMTVGCWAWSSEYRLFLNWIILRERLAKWLAHLRCHSWEASLCLKWFCSSFVKNTRTYYFSASVLLFVRRICNGLFEIVVYSSRRRGRHWTGREDRRWGAHCSWIEVFSRRQIHLHWIGWLQVGLCVLITLSQFIFATLIAPSEWHFDGLWNCVRLDWDTKCTNLSL